MSEEDSEPKKKYTPVPYKVGKYHPPKHTQFKPGQSGNPKGRKKKPVHVGAIVDDLFDRKVSVLIEDKPVKIPWHRGFVEEHLQRCGEGPPPFAQVAF